MKLFYLASSNLLVLDTYNNLTNSMKPIRVLYNKKFYSYNQFHIGNFDIHAERKILVINEIKWYEIWTRPKG